MARGKRIIPDFMADNPNDTFRLLLPLKLHLDEDKYGNSHFKVIIKNMTQNEIFSYDLSPELLFTHFPLEKSFSNGQQNDYYQNKTIFEKDFIIGTTNTSKNSSYKLHELLDEKSIVSISGWKRKFLNEAKYINCYLIEQNGDKIIIPDFAIAIYYYFRFSEMREATLDCNLKDLYVMCTPDRDNAKIVLQIPRNDEDAAFIHRYACNKIAQKEFDNIGKYINNYLSYMRNIDIDKEIESIPIKANFPIKEEFKIETRCSILTNEESKEKYYFIHEILNDYSDIGFDKFTKIIEQNKIVTTIDELENLPKVDKEIAGNITEILKGKPANKKYTQTHHRKDKKKSCGSLKGIEIEHETITKDTLIDILKLYQEQQNNESIDQSLTESSNKGEKNISKIVISSEFKKENEERNSLNEIDNFTVFKQYVGFLKVQNPIEYFDLQEVQNLPEYILRKTNSINPKCRMKKRSREYLTATFKYKNLYVGLLELENYFSSAASTWVIVSQNRINNSIFNKFLKLYFEDGNSISKIDEKCQKFDPRFCKKNHERDENLSEQQLARWYVGLLGKITL
jgi:hypothetical protein